MATISRAERNAAIAAAAAAQVANTCPWAGDGETPSTASSRQPSSRNTCPWAPDEVLPPKQRRSPTSSNTCPWGTGVQDRDSTKLADAARKRERVSPKNYGAAGAGAPKMFSVTGQAVVSQNTPPAAELTQKFDQADLMGFGPGQRREEQFADVAPASYGEGAEEAPAEDADEEEQRNIIQHCLAEGLSEEQIMEILDDWQNQKLVRNTQDKLSDQPRPVAEALVSSGPSGGSTLAASRQAKASKGLSFGPSDAEVVDILKDFSKENLTPPESPPNCLTIAARRKKEKEPSVASVGSFDSEKSRAAYFQSKAQMDAVKNKNRCGAGIF